MTMDTITYMETHMSRKESRQARVEGAVNEISALLSEGDYGNGDFHGSSNQETIDMLVDSIQNVLAEEQVHSKHHHVAKEERKTAFTLVENCFNRNDQVYQQQEEHKQFEITEKFILREQITGGQRREQARLLEAAEEKSLAAEIAQIKGFRERSKHLYATEELQRKIADAERSYLTRRMVVSKASQVASAECRVQFSRVREFFEELHAVRKEALLREHKRSEKRLDILHKLQQSDSRVKALETQIADRVYKKKLQDLNELHIAQSMEEAVYMESMLELLDKVQTGKEMAARETFELHVSKLKERQIADGRRTGEMDDFRSQATIEIARVLASYIKDDKENEQFEQSKEEEIDMMERRKEFGNGNGGVSGTNNSNDSRRKKVSIGELYDTVLWSVVKNHKGLTSSSSDFSSDLDWEEDQDDLAEGGIRDPTQDMDMDMVHGGSIHHASSEDGGSTTGGGSVGGDDGSSIGGSSSGRNSVLSAAGLMHVKQLTREFRKQEKELAKKHRDEEKHERMDHRRAVRALKLKHQCIIDGLIEGCLMERHNLREGIEQRMEALAERQKKSTEELREVVRNDTTLMHDAITAEHKRVQDVEAESFSKAQTIISAQVFHEVRNALSSVIAMSEIACSMKMDATVSAAELVSNVEDMLDQIKEVVDYALKMLNNVLDISKITSGTFEVSGAPFDLDDLVARATRMQMAKSNKLKMMFHPGPQPNIALSDSDIVVRIIANLISNAIKFTTAGGVQPFICPVEDIEGHQYHDDLSSDPNNRAVGISTDLDLPNPRKRLIAVGVADTGSGISKRKLKSAEMTLSQCDPANVGNNHGASNSGFGLYLIHLLAKALDSRLQLSSLEKCRKVLSEDMLKCLDGRQRRKSSIMDKHDSSPKTKDLPGKGTVLYITLPVYEDGECAKKALEAKHEASAAPLQQQLQRQHVRAVSSSSSLAELAKSDLDVQRAYSFSPRPVTGSFRILVADDVLMLRKGLVHVVSSIFQDCPVSVSSACTAEDMLRAVNQNPYDLIISDNLFHHDASKLKRMPAFEENAKYGRPSLTFDGHVSPKNEIRQKLASFFANERFTLEEGDGELTGYEALQILQKATNPVFPTPILMLLTGHKIDSPPHMGIISAQKPLKRDDFITLLEMNVPKLLATGVVSEDICGGSMDGCSTSDTASESSCSEDMFGVQTVSSETSVTPVVNAHGTQVFVARG